MLRLTTLENLPNLNSIGTGNNVWVPSLSMNKDNVSIVIENNPNLSDCCLLVDFFNEGIYELSGEIYVANNATTCNHQDIIESECITYQGDINVTTQTEVEELSALLSEKTKIGGNVEIIEADGTSDPIIDLSVFNTIDTITGKVTVEGLTHIDTLKGFSHLQSIEGNFVIQNNPSLTHIGSFDALTRIEGILDIRTNASLTHTGHFPLLDYIKDRYLIINNDVLKVANGLPALDSLDELLILGNPALNSAGSYPSLQYISRSFKIGDRFNGGRPNPKLVDIGNYPMLTTIGGELFVHDNDSLKTLGNLGALHTIGGFFDVTDNDALLSLGKLPHVDNH